MGWEEVVPNRLPTTPNHPNRLPSTLNKGTDMPLATSPAFYTVYFLQKPFGFGARKAEGDWCGTEVSILDPENPQTEMISLDSRIVAINHKSVVGNTHEVIREKLSAATTPLNITFQP